MNVTSQYIREQLKVFDGGIFQKVSKNALLRDTGYYISIPKELRKYVDYVRLDMSYALGVKINDLPFIYQPNGRWDCDNYAILGCAYLKALHDKDCREKDRPNEKEFAIWPMARADIDHTQAISLTTEGWKIVEFMTGEITEEIPKILMVG